jgi:hypothetical protein
MILATEAPDELFYDGIIPAPFTGDGCILEAVEDLPAGSVARDSPGRDRSGQIDSWELPAYLRACGR